MSYIALDFETTGLDTETCGYVCMSAWKEDKGFVMDLTTPSGLSRFKKWHNEKEQEGVTWIYHNAKFELKLLWRLGLYPTKWIDTMALAYNMYCGTLNRKDLKSLAKNILGYESVTSYTQVAADKLTPELEKYALEDAKYTYELFEFFRGHLNERQKKSGMIDSEVAAPVAMLEKNGVALNKKLFEEKALLFNKIITQTEDAMHRMMVKYFKCNDKFNFLSTKDLSVALSNMEVNLPITEKYYKNSASYLNKWDVFLQARRKQVNKYWDRHVKLYSGKITDKQITSLEKSALKLIITNIVQWGKLWSQKPVIEYKTGAKELEQMTGNSREVNTFFNLLGRLRKYKKLVSTYCHSFTDFIESNTGRLHTNFKHLHTNTGRFSCGKESGDVSKIKKPNLQNLPRGGIGGFVRRGIVAPEGKSLVVFDFSQIELRVIAALAGEDAMIEAFNNGEDPHKSTAAKIFGKPISEVTKQERHVGKTINFSLVNLQGAENLAKQIDCKTHEAEEYIKSFYDSHPKTKELTDSTQRMALRYKATYTAYGSRRLYPNILSEEQLILFRKKRKEAFDKYKQKTGNDNLGYFEMCDAVSHESETIKKILIKLSGHSKSMRECFNHLIQGTAANIMRISCCNIYRALRSGVLPNGTEFVLCTHDEFGLYVPDDQVENVMKVFKVILEQPNKIEGLIPYLKWRVPIEADGNSGKNYLEAK